MYILPLSSQYIYSLTIFVAYAPGTMHSQTHLRKYLRIRESLKITLKKIYYNSFYTLDYIFMICFIFNNTDKQDLLLFDDFYIIWSF
jgi:hypothetical protein